MKTWVDFAACENEEEVAGLHGVTDVRTVVYTKGWTYGRGSPTIPPSSFDQGHKIEVFFKIAAVATWYTRGGLIIEG